MIAQTVVQVLETGEHVRKRTMLTEEAVLEIVADPLAVETLVCSGTNLEELAIGHLLVQGKIDTLEDFASWSLQQHRFTAVLRPLQHKHTDRTNTWKDTWIFTLAELFAKDTPQHQKTHGVHSCTLMQQGVILCQREDLGRHNAMDKVLGYAVLHQIPLGQCLLFTSGRLPVDMLQKVIASGVGVVATNAVPTVQAVTLAKQAGITVIGRVRKDSFLLYTSQADDRLI